MDFDSVAAAGSMFGSGAIIVLDDSVCVVKTAARLVRFYAHESCGKCTPCREGTPWLRDILEQIEAGQGQAGDIALLEDVSSGIAGKTFCPLGEAAIGFLGSSLKYFREEYVQHIEGRRCPMGVNAA
jgi:NADH-quinone oxidoreductase subunit F